MNLYGLSTLARVNSGVKRVQQLGTEGGAASAANGYPGTYGGYGTGLLPGGRIPVSPSNTGQPRSLPGVDFPVVGYPETGWNPGQSNPYGAIIPGATVGGPQVITTQNIPPNDASQLPINTFYLNQQEFGGGPNAPTYRNLPMPYPAPDMNIPTNEDVSPTPVNTFLSNYNPNAGTPRRTGFGGGYPDLSGLPPVSVSAPYGTASNPYPIPGYGGLPSTYGGGQSWQSNAARGGGFAGIAASNLGFGGGLSSLGGGGWQGLSELPSGLGAMSYQQAFGGGGARVLQN